MSRPSSGPRSHVAVFAALIMLTAATLGLSHAQLGSWHAFVGLAIALAKALLILLFFMNAWSSPRVTWLVILSALFWLGILMGLTMTDYLSLGGIPARSEVETATRRRLSGEYQDIRCKVHSVPLHSREMGHINRIEFKQAT